MTITRNLSEVKYANLSQAFLLKQKSFNCQYAPLYAERLANMRKDVKRAAMAKWLNLEVKNLVDLVKDERAIIIGTLYKEMKNKPNILKELADDENNMIPYQPVLDRDAKYIDGETDELILEDDLQRILLIDAPGHDHVKSNRLCSGLVLALIGFENEESKFEVEEICFKNLEFYNALPRELVSTGDKDSYIVFLSGLELDDSTAAASYLYKFQLFIDFLRGDFVCDGAGRTAHMLANTSRLVIAGNSLAACTQTKDLLNKAKYLTKNYIVGSVSAVRQLDEYLQQLVAKLEVDLMPGEFDPANLMLPQQPLHHAMFTRTCAQSSAFKYNLHTVSNPYRFELSGVCLLGCSGQFVDDMRRSTSMDSACDLMRLSLSAGHLAPTCPDTLACYPYYGQDPFILDALPDVYFAGNQPDYRHEVYMPAGQQRSVHLISLPRFSVTNSCVFLNLNTLQTEQFFF